MRNFNSAFLLVFVGGVAMATACGDDPPPAGSDGTGGTTGGSTGTGGTTGSGGSTGGSTSSGTGGTTGSGGSTGSGGTSSDGGAGSADNPAECPATQPTEGESCSVDLDFGEFCSYTDENCICAGGGGFPGGGGDDGGGDEWVCFPDFNGGGGDGFGFP